MRPFCFTFRPQPDRELAGLPLHPLHPLHVKSEDRHGETVAASDYMAATARKAAALFRKPLVPPLINSPAHRTSKDIWQHQTAAWRRCACWIGGAGGAAGTRYFEPDRVYFWSGVRKRL